MQNDIPVTLVELQTATGSDVVLSEIAGYANSKWPEKKDLSQDVQRYEKVKDEISMYNGILMHADHIIPPVTLREICICGQIWMIWLFKFFRNVLFVKRSIKV